MEVAVAPVDVPRVIRAVSVHLLHSDEVDGVHLAMLLTRSWQVGSDQSMSRVVSDHSHRAIVLCGININSYNV